MAQLNEDKKFIELLSKYSPVEALVATKDSTLHLLKDGISQIASQF